MVLLIIIGLIVYFYVISPILTASNAVDDAA
jgi:hypothetical protein